MVNEASNDNSVAIITVTQNCVMMLETNPVLIAIGKNTTTITKVIAVTVNQFQLHHRKLRAPLFCHFHVTVNVF